MVNAAPVVALIVAATSIVIGDPTGIVSPATDETAPPLNCSDAPQGPRDHVVPDDGRTIEGDRPIKSATSPVSPGNVRRGPSITNHAIGEDASRSGVSQVGFCVLM